MEENKTVVEEKKPEQKKGISPVVLVIAVAIALVVGWLGGGYLFNVTNEEKDTPKQEEVEEQEEEIIPVDASQVLTTAMEKFLILASLDEAGTNVLESAYRRNTYLFCLLQPEASITTDESQESFYVDSSTFEEKYKETYGSNYSYTKPDTSCDIYPSIAGQDKVCWLTTLGGGTYVEEYTFMIEDGKYDGEDFVIKGDFENTQGRSKKFALRYSVENKKGYLKSIVIE